MYPIKISTAITIPFFVHDSSGDGVTGLVDGDFTKRISQGSGAFGAMVVTVTEMENGWYSIPLSVDHSDTLGILTISFSTGSSQRTNLQFRVHTRLPDDHAFPNTTGRGMDVLATGEVGIDLDNVNGALGTANFDADFLTNALFADNVFNTEQFAADFLTNALLADNVIAAEQIAAGAITASEAPNLDAAITTRAVAGDAMALTAGAVDDVWDEDIVAAHGGADAAGLLLRALGALISQRGNNPTLNALLGVPDAAGDDLSETVWAEGTRDLTALGFQFTNADFAAGAIDANAIAAAAITSSEAPNLDAAITTRATPAEVATALTDIRLDELASATAGGVDATIGSFFDLIMNADGGQTFSQATDSLEALAGASAPSAAVIADAVWDEDIVAAHGGADAAGLLLRALGALISQRANNATLNALLGVPDAAGDDLSETVWSEGTRDLTALGFQIAAGDFAAGAIDANAIAAAAITAVEAPNLDAAISSRAVAGDAMALTAGAVDDIWDEAQAGHVGAGTFGLFLDATISGRAVAGDAMNLAAGAIVAATFGAGAIDAAALATDAGQEIADRVLARSIASGADGGRTVQDAFRLLRNRRAVAGAVLTVYEEDDLTPAWTAAVTTAAGDPVDEIDPA